MISTDWDTYYKKPQRFTSITRRWTCAKLVSILSNHVGNKSFSICEYGGANSCIAGALDNAFDIENYHIIDTNEYGLSLLKNLHLTANISSELASVLDKPSTNQSRHDVVVSIGLVEHFAPVETKRAIQTHFENCRKGGMVLITFPTPTRLYKTIRWFAEKMGIWLFPDERPLHFSEVLDAIPENCSLLHRSIHWKIGLTQGIVLVGNNAN